MQTPVKLHGLFPTMRFILAMIFLTLVVNLVDFWQYGLFAPLRPSPELAVVLLLICAAATWGGEISRFWYVPLVPMLLFCALFRLGDFLVPRFFEREFNLYIDTRYIPDLLHFLYHSAGAAKFFFALALVAILAIVTSYAMWWALRITHSYLTEKRQRRFFLILGTALLIIAATASFWQIAIFSNSFSGRLISEIEFVLYIYRHKQVYAAQIQEVSEQAQKTPSNLRKLRGSNVYIFLVESYGHTAIAKPEHFAMIEPAYRQFTAMLDEQKFHSCSNYLTAPTFGGKSWLTHGALACGVKTFNQVMFDLLVTSEAKSLSRYFNDAGYRTVSVMPGTTKPWPEGEFFGFQEKYYAWKFDYQGPKYGWSPMTDQYILDFIYRREVEFAQKPLLIEYVLISSHAPFHIQPPYIEDWTTIGNGQIYSDKEPVTFPIVWPDLTNASEGYMASIIYDLTVLREYLRHYIKDNSLILILGDHQPHGAITGPGSPWSVPIHIISRNEEFIKPFHKRGYSKGMIPQQPLPHAGMEDFLLQFLGDFSEE